MAITDFVDTGNYANSFYGTYDHYQRIGWYFDKIVDDLEDLEDCKDIMTGRFVLVKTEDAIFMRTSDNYTENYPYQRYEIQGNELIPVGNVNVYETEGFRFIGYATRKAMLLLDDAYIDVDNIAAYKIANTNNVRSLSAYYFPTEYNKEYWKDLEE